MPSAKFKGWFWFECKICRERYLWNGRGLKPDECANCMTVEEIEVIERQLKGILADPELGKILAEVA